MPEKELPDESSQEDVMADLGYGPRAHTPEELAAAIQKQNELAAERQSLDETEPSEGEAEPKKSWPSAEEVETGTSGLEKAREALRRAQENAGQ